MIIIIVTKISHEVKTYKPTYIITTQSQAKVVQIRKSIIIVEDITTNQKGRIKKPFRHTNLGDTVPIIYQNELMLLDYNNIY